MVADQGYGGDTESEVSAESQTFGNGLKTASVEKAKRGGQGRKEAAGKG